MLFNLKTDVTDPVPPIKYVQDLKKKKEKIATGLTRKHCKPMKKNSKDTKGIIIEKPSV